MNRLQNVAPSEIEQRSFAIIEDEFFHRTGLRQEEFSDHQFQIIRRVIHATGDFSFAETLVFHEHAIESGLEAITRGMDVYVDVTMGASGISRTRLERFGGRVLCHINDPQIAEKALESRKTRTETAIDHIDNENLGLIAVGNAPTALVATITKIASGELSPRLVVGVPVGFVNARESKELLIEQSTPYIANLGRKGGTPVAVAIVNALLVIAAQLSPVA